MRSAVCVCRFLSERAKNERRSKRNNENDKGNIFELMMNISSEMDLWRKNYIGTQCCTIEWILRARTHKHQCEQIHSRKRERERHHTLARRPKYQYQLSCVICYCRYLFCLTIFGLSFALTQTFIYSALNLSYTHRHAYLNLWLHCDLT